MRSRANPERTGKLNPQEDALSLLSARLAARYGVVPLRLEEDGLVVAMEHPEDLETLDELGLAIGRPVRGEEASRQLISEAIKEYYGVGAATLETLASNRHFETSVEVDEASIDEMGADASIINFVNQLIVDAYNSRATDIHLEPFENVLRVRYRIDGLLFDIPVPESIRHFRESIASRVKIMANMDIAEKRLPQDGRFRVRIGGRDFDLRVSVIPIAHGESINVRILQRSSVLMGLESIGFSEEHFRVFQQLIKKTHGIVLLTGPTGSGKTTTLYACLNEINSTERKIITIEDPVEYQIEGICQMQVRVNIGFTFANGLRSMLRHDPDVMMVGEIRDFETAELAIRCALTGHLVFSTLHTNDAPGAVPRLLDMEVEPFLLASSVEAVIAQRLVRIVCSHCSEPDVPDRETLAEMGIDPSDAVGKQFRRGAGCEKCRGYGYLGRTAIHEMMAMDDELRQLVGRASGVSIKNHALRKGMRTLRADGWGKVIRGITTVDEVLRVTQEDESAKALKDIPLAKG